MGSPTHYDELGVRPDASTAEIRAAYVQLARRHHPDHLGDAPSEERAAAEARMARVNAAWTVLSDPRRRSAYDAGLEQGAHVHRGGVHDVDFEFRPLEDDDEVFDPDLFDDTPTGARGLSRILTFLPATLFSVGFVCIVLGAMLGFGGVVVFGLVQLGLAALSFLFIPLVALSNAMRSDRDG